GVAAAGPAAAALARSALSRDDAALEGLQGVGGRGILVLLGEAGALPWADGAIYFGREADAGGLLLPATRAPDVPLPLLARAPRARFPQLSPPLVILPSTRQVVSASGARTLARGVLAAS